MEYVAKSSDSTKRELHFPSRALMPYENVGEGTESTPECGIQAARQTNCALLRRHPSYTEGIAREIRLDP